MNKSWHQFLTYALSIVITRGLSLIMLPFITRYLAPEQIGRLELLATIGVFIGLFITVCLHEALYRFAGHYRSLIKQYVIASKLFTLSCFVAIIITMIVLVASLFIPNESLLPITRQELVLTLITVMFTGPLSIATAWLRMQDKARLFLAISSAASLIQVLWIVVALTTQASVASILWAALISTLIQIVALQWVNRLSLRTSSLKSIQTYTWYTFPIVGSGVVAFGLSGAEKWILAASTSLLELGWYAIAAKFALAACLLVQPFGMWWMPKRFNVLRTAGNNQTVKITQAGLIYVCIVTTCMSFIAPLFITAALPDTYHSAINYIVPVLIIALFKELSEITNIGILYRKQTKQLLVINSACAAAGILLATIASQWGIMGILTTLCTVGFVRFIAVYIVSQRLLRLEYNVLPVAFIILLTVVLISFSSQVTQVESRLVLSLLAPICVLLVTLILQRLSHINFPSLYLRER
ncbi:lipopolysaccharide biosynthesis protein [Vibrio sp. 10N.261.51.F12]|uniref:lipopolysaccharide biosynthesis protein n=1 Tax=Vibrio sp. 10N.261.51.F12 TaxID=3229679 RepID=UPI0035505506